MYGPDARLDAASAFSVNDSTDTDKKNRIRSLKTLKTVFMSSKQTLILSLGSGQCANSDLGSGSVHGSSVCADVVVSRHTLQPVGVIVRHEWLQS